MTNQKKQAGVGLLEVLISVLILGVTLLGIAAMQARALRNGQSSFESSQMTIHTYSILEAMRANRAVAVSGGYDHAMTCAVPTDAGGTLASSDFSQWLTGLKTSLSGTAGAAGDTSTCGQIGCASATCTITVQWDDGRGSVIKAANDSSSNRVGSQTRQITTVATL